MVRLTWGKLLVRLYGTVQWSSRAMIGRLSVLDTIAESAYRDEAESNHTCKMLVYAYNFVYCYNDVNESRFSLFVLLVLIGIR
jgi:hypothetical protein